MKKISLVLMIMLFVLGMATAAFAATSGTAIPGDSTYAGSSNFAAPLTNNLATNDAAYDNGVGNANGTGIGVGGTGVNTGVIVNVTGQRTHGEYQNNTNSCASCHQTHTAAGKSLLFKNGVYTTCTACHDGTLGFYNVFANGAMASTAGTFGGTADGNASVHLANGTLDHKLAPGGKLGGTEANWTEKFDCASCHAPHGSYSDRLLNYNPNNMANLPSTDGGQKVVDAVVYDVYPAANASAPAYLYWRTTGAGLAASGLSGATANAAATGHDAETVVVLLKKTTASPWSYSVDNTPWLYGYDFYTKADKTRIKMYWSHLRTSATSSGSDAAADARIQPGDNAHFMWGQAFAYGSDLAAATHGDTARVYAVKLIDEADYPTTLVTDFGGVDIIKLNTGAFVTEGRGVKISAWCGACHTDYNAKSGNLTGMFGTQSYRHTTNSDSYACLRCHFAHGTDVEVMSDAKDETVATLVAGGMLEADAKAYLLDNNASSALKRYTNMAVCWKCHTDSKATQLKNNEFFWTNYDTVPHGF